MIGTRFRKSSNRSGNCDRPLPFPGAATLGMIRICAGAMLLYTHLVWGLDLTTFFGAHGWLSPSAVSSVE